MEKFLTIMLTLILAGCLSGHSNAQPRSLGGVFSFSGIDASYQHYTRDSVFLEIGAGIDFEGILDGTAKLPGAKLALTCNFIFFRRDFKSGTMDLYAGPGFTAGLVRQDGGRLFGPMAGLCGRIGLEYRFKVPVILSVDFMPVLGMHLDYDKKQNLLKFYSNGLNYAYIPRVGIRYRF